MNQEREFSLTRHLRKKGNGEKRTPLLLETYDQTLPIITDVLRKALQSPKNKNGYTKFVIFGSWARRDKQTGPTANSDLDLFVYKRWAGLISLQTFRMGSLVKKLMHRAELENGVQLPEVKLEAEIGQETMAAIKSEQMSLTKSGYIVVSAK